MAPVAVVRVAPPHITPGWQATLEHPVQTNFMWMSAKSLVPYRQCSAGKTLGWSALLARSSADTAICAKPLAR
jgi:hypothetical protein